MSKGFKRYKLISILCSLLIFLLLLVSCTRTDKSNIPITERELPDMILVEADYTFGQPDKKPLLLHAESITIYPTGQKMEISKVNFTQKSKNEELNTVELSGSCDFAVSTDNEVISMQGNVHLYKYSDNVEIFCEDLLWDDTTQEIRANGSVTVNYKDGTSITGTGFKALLEENVYEFNEIYEGTFTNAEEEE